MSGKLFESIQVGRNKLEHRVVLAPLTRFRANDQGVPQDIARLYYEQRASKGGLLITEATFVSPDGGGLPHVPGIYSPAQIEGWKKVTEAVHKKGGVIYLQLWFLGRAGMSMFLPDKHQPVSASAIAITGQVHPGMPYETPRSLELSEIPQIVNSYKQAALNAIESGFDGVEIHGANGYLIDQFINTNSNKRTDMYGGSIENRCRLALEVIEAVSTAIGQERTAIRLSPYNTFQDMKEDTPVETFSYLTSEIQKRFANLAFLHFIKPRISGDTEIEGDEQPLGLEPFREIWKGAFISAGGYTPESALEAAEQTGDLIAFGRHFIANPDLPARIRNNWELNPYNRSTFYTPGPQGKRARDEYMALNESVKNTYEGWQQAMANLDDGVNPVDEEINDRLQQDRYEYLDIQKKYYQQYFQTGKNLEKYIRKYTEQ
ncbi:FMN-linked oxidoreductase [Basidiobolus meristosporus CBS 931.73]|uniref:FMN-linked oxidoreductase n=1 Tax=Basidiobolus meristosporus CBS 931.73 TaxID=1314790 RepID=A0A1Y1YXZ0_9FUNG|nr:FMN-linked oxidoreductase [Basidiobolus meristosporus CBS 931.73]|eukprot:ORY02891.1 FMN-linked oxidoreductase [Basidiobolus meristosporus CBS 931.73]